MFSLSYAEFYITNVCNLTCQGCNRFNSFRFKGWQSWDDYRDIYAQWSQRLKLNTVTIMGGEPLLNPTFYQWLAGIRSLWPRAQIGIASNGTQLEKHQRLYDILKNDLKIELGVSLHNESTKDSIIQSVERFLTGPLTHEFDDTQYREKLRITDANGVSVLIHYNWWFHQGAVRTNEQGRLTLHTSDINRAHEICHSKTCHHFDRGQLYKCGPAALFPEFDRQHPLDLTEEQRAIMMAVPKVSATDSDDALRDFLDHINDPIPQCQFCPEVYVGDQIFAIEKKSQ